MRSVLCLLILIVILILLSFLQQIPIWKSFVAEKEVELQFVLPYISPNCSYSSRYLQFVVPDCDLYAATPAVKLSGRLSLYPDDELFQRKRLMVKDISVNIVSGSSLIDWIPLLEIHLARCRNWLYQLVLDSTSPLHAGLVISLLFGSTDWLNSSLEPYFENTGTLHILAASGSHVALITTFFTIGAGFAPYRQKGLIVLSGVVFYQLLLGAAPSITRATAMSVLLLFSRYFLFRKTSVTYSLLVGSGVLLMWRPEWLFSIGFQLSVVATIGILVVHPIITRIIRRKSKYFSNDGSLFLTKKSSTIRSYFVDQLLVGLSAEATILPLLLFHFSSTPVLGFVATVAVAWFVPFLMNSLLIGVLTNLVVKTAGISSQVNEVISFVFFFLPVQFFLDLMRLLSHFNWLELGVPQ